MKKKLNALLFCFLIGSKVFAQAKSMPTGSLVKGSELLVQFENEAATAAFMAQAKTDWLKTNWAISPVVAAWQVYSLGLSDVFYEKKDTVSAAGIAERAATIEAFQAKLNGVAGIKTVQKNRHVQLRGVKPNDDYFEAQQNLKQIDAENAWTFGTGGVTAGGDTIAVAVFDGGVDFDCDDLKANLWHNYGEVPNNGLDDDGNGYIDDYNGWNVDTRRDDVSTGNTHGTGIAGVIGAQGNNGIGVAGINWQVKMVVMRGIGTEAKLVEAYYYMYRLRQEYDRSGGRKGAFLVATNASFGIDRAQASNFPLWCAMYDSLGKRGILTAAAVADRNYDADVQGDMPTGCESDFLIGVTAVDAKDNRLNYVAYGKKTVDIAAPTEGFSVFPANQYVRGVGGTSGATPHVTGAIALLHSFNNEAFAATYKAKPAETARLLKRLILEGADKKENLASEVMSGGRLNLYRSFAGLNRLYEAKRSSYSLIYPNPAQYVATIEWVDNSGKQLNAVVYDELGVKRAEQTVDNEPFRYNKLSFYTATWASGVYYVLVSIDGVAQPPRKLVILR